jgi:hypothetical protein
MPYKRHGFAMCESISAIKSDVANRAPWRINKISNAVKWSIYPQLISHGTEPA